MGYSDQDLESTYENLINSSQQEVSVWTGSSVYFDDEIVEYQGRHYLALCKTSAEVPGRSKAGIWKEIIIEEELSSQYKEAYEELSKQDSVKEHKVKVDAQNIAQEKVRKAEVIQQGSIATQVKRSTKKIQIPAKNSPCEPSNTIKPANKPLSKKKTLREQEEEKAKTSKPLVVPPTSNLMKKMKIAPSEQSIVNVILKEMEFKKIKGFNPDENNITKNLILPQTKEGAKLEWNSSHTEVISSKGEVTRPVAGHDIAVNLSLTVSINKTSATRFFTLWVKAEERVLSDEECVDTVYEVLSFEHIKGLNTKASVITENLELLTHGLHDTHIFWASKSRELLDESGIFHKMNLNKNTKIRIYAIIVKGNVEKLKHFDLILKV
ncbi:MAG: hypothetical protein COA44_12575 [Arcobacter sp.]|nr:MAG: hypothetical protein COA44_12575 [Arcobacter sp.]